MKVTSSIWDNKTMFYCFQNNMKNCFFSFSCSPPFLISWNLCCFVFLSHVIGIKQADRQTEGTDNNILSFHLDEGTLSSLVLVKSRVPTQRNAEHKFQKVKWKTESKKERAKQQEIWFWRNFKKWKCSCKSLSPLIPFPLKKCIIKTALQEINGDGYRKFKLFSAQVGENH